MLSSLSDKLCAAFRPLAAIRHAHRHYETIAQDPCDRRNIWAAGIATEGTLTVSSFLTYASLLPFERHVQDLTLGAGKAGLFVGGIYAAQFAASLYACGKEDLSKKQARVQREP